MEREYKTLTALRKGEIVDLGGICFRMIEGEIVKGDLYIAERNTGPKLLTAKIIDNERGWIMPTSNDYAFDLNECVRIEEVK